MAKAFWPGYSWRVLAHRRSHEGRGATSIGVGSWHCLICGFKGADYKKHSKKCPADFASDAVPDGDWNSPQGRARQHLRRALRHSSSVAMHSEEVAESVQFDELVIDDWFHLEQMSERHYWMRVGEYDLNVHIDGKGVATVGVVKNA